MLRRTHVVIACPSSLFLSSSPSHNKNNDDGHQQQGNNNNNKVSSSQHYYSASMSRSRCEEGSIVDDVVVGDDQGALLQRHNLLRSTSSCSFHNGSSFSSPSLHNVNGSNNNTFVASSVSSPSRSPSSSLFHSTSPLLSRFTLPNGVRIGVETVYNSNIVKPQKSSSATNNEHENENESIDATSISSSLAQQQDNINPLLKNIPQTIYLYSWDGFESSSSPASTLSPSNEEEARTGEEEHQKPNVKSHFILDFSPSMDSYGFSDPTCEAVSEACSKLHRAQVTNEPQLTVFSSNAASSPCLDFLRKKNKNSSSSSSLFGTNRIGEEGAKEITKKTLLSLKRKISGATHPTAAFDLVVSQLQSQCNNNRNKNNSSTTVNITFMTDGMFNGESRLDNYAKDFARIASSLSKLVYPANENGFACITANLVGLLHDQVKQMKVLRDALVEAGGIETTYTVCENKKNLSKIFNERALMSIEEGMISSMKSISFKLQPQENNSSSSSSSVLFTIREQHIQDNNENIVNLGSAYGNNYENDFPIDLTVSTVPFHLNIPRQELEKLAPSTSISHHQNKNQWVVEVSPSEDHSSSDLEKTIKWEEHTSTLKTHFLNHALSVRKNLNQDQFTLWLDKALLFGGRTFLVCKNIRDRLKEIEDKFAANDQQKQKEKEFLKLFGEICQIGQSHIEIPLLKLKDELRLSLVTKSYSNSLFAWCRDQRDDFFELMSQVQTIAAENISEKVRFENWSKTQSPQQARRSRMLERRALKNMAISAATDDYLSANKNNNNNNDYENDNDDPTNKNIKKPILDQTKVTGSLTSLVSIDPKANAASVTFKNTSGSYQENVVVSPLCSIPLARLNVELPIHNFDWLRGTDVSINKIAGVVTSLDGDKNNNKITNNAVEFHPQNFFMGKNFDFSNLAAVFVEGNSNDDKTSLTSPSLTSPSILPLPVHPLSSSSSPQTCRVLFRNNQHVRSSISNIFTGSPDCFGEHYWKLYCGFFKELFISENPLWVFALDAFRMAMNCCSVADCGTKECFVFQTDYREPMSVVDCLRDIYHNNNFPRDSMKGWDAISILLVANHKTYEKAFPFSASKKTTKRIDQHLFECRARCWSNALVSVAVENFASGFSSPQNGPASSLPPKNHDSLRFKNLTNTNTSTSSNSSSSPSNKDFNFSFTETMQSSLKNLDSLEFSSDKLETVCFRLLQLSDYLYYEFNDSNDRNGSTLELYLKLGRKLMKTNNSYNSSSNGTHHQQATSNNSVPQLTVNRINLKLLTEFFVPSETASILKGICIGGRAVAGLKPGKHSYATKKLNFTDGNKISQVSPLSNTSPSPASSPTEIIHRFYRSNRSHLLRSSREASSSSSSVSFDDITTQNNIRALQNTLPPFRFDDLQKQRMQDLFDECRRGKSITSFEQLRLELTSPSQKIFSPTQKELFDICWTTFGHPSRAMSELFKSLITFPENVVPNLEWKTCAEIKQQHDTIQNRDGWILTGGLFSNAITAPLSPCFLHPLPHREFGSSLHRHELGLDRFAPADVVAAETKRRKPEIEMDKKKQEVEKKLLADQVNAARLSLMKETGVSDVTMIDPNIEAKRINEIVKKFVAERWIDSQVKKPIAHLEKVVAESAGSEFEHRFSEFKNRVVPLLEPLSVEQFALATEPMRVKKGDKSNSITKGLQNFVMKILGW